MTDRLTLTRAFEGAGMQSEAAERIATEIYDAIHDNVATKADIAAVRADLAAVKVDRDEIAVDGGTIDDFEFGIVFAQAVDLVLDLFVLDRKTGQRDLQTV